MSANHNSHEFQKEVFVPQYFNSKPTVAGKRWRRWQVLVVYGVAVALIAGVIGGFTGKAISDGQRVHRYPSTSFSFSTANGSWAPINGTWTRLLPIPATNCTPRWKRKCLPPTHSEHFTVHYTTLCNTHWADEHLIAISSPTPSDCIEACHSYNKHTQAKKCLGASFVPLWWDQSSAINETGEPFNCLLMGDNKTMVANGADWERVALWLDGSCPEQLVDD